MCVGRRMCIVAQRRQNIGLCRYGWEEKEGIEKQSEKLLLVH